MVIQKIFIIICRNCIKKRNGEFFLWETGDIITPLTKNEAKKWAEKNLTGTEYEEVFDPVEE